MLALLVVPTFAAAQDVLPRPEQPFKGHIGRTTQDSKLDFPQEVKAPQGAPNILLIMTDDVGFGATSPFGGPVPTPAFDRLAKTGPALHAVPHHGAVLADARSAARRA
jgi:arylsulfatase